jgi:hypothetical protein
MICAFVEDARGIESVCKVESTRTVASRAADRQDEKESCSVIRYMYQMK